MNIILYGIKNCDTVKKARDWLTTNNIEYKFHDFRADGLEASQVTNWISAIGLDNLVNRRSTTWKELDTNIKESFSEKNAAAIIAEYPTLIKRPLLKFESIMHVGFKDSEYSKIFN